jgi:AcrR family transcriptional regulator
LIAKKKKNAPARMTRAEQRDRTRKALIEAASLVVGQHGYAGATVTAITRRARVAQGTFYNYFDTREDLFDQLLPALTRDMFAFIRAAAASARTSREREEATMQAYFDFLHRVPSFYRILYEAETIAPAAYRANMKMIAANYARQLRGARDRGEIVAFTPRELEAVAYMLMGARHYLSMRHQHGGRRSRAMPDGVVQTYIKLIRGLYLP